MTTCAAATSSGSLCRSPPADGSDTSAMGAIGRGHRVHWLLSGRPTGTAHGALQFAGHLVRGSETAGGAERRRQASARGSAAAQPIPRTSAYACSTHPPPPPFPPSLSTAQLRQSGGREVRQGRKISCCYGDDRQRRSRAVCWAGVEVVEGGEWGGHNVSLETIFCGNDGGCTCKSSGSEDCIT